MNRPPNATAIPQPENTSASSVTKVASLGYAPALDGLRALAILAVIGYHFGWLKGGISGVTLFFSLSGFLISSLLTEEWLKSGRISLRSFYARRALRLLPALLLMLAADLAFVLLFRSGWFRKAGLAAIASSLFYVSNWVAALRILPLYQLGHTWSLSVEEQFYLLWPLLLLFSLRLCSSRRVHFFLLLGGAFALSAERLLLAASGASEVRLYYGLDTRADALLYGAAAASAFSSSLADAPAARRLLTVLGPIAAALLAAHLFLGWVEIGRSTALTVMGAYTGVAVLASVVIFHVATLGPKSLLVSALSVSPLRFVGRVSYGLYLWHQLVGAWVDEVSPGNAPILIVIKLSATAVLTLISYYLIEKPFLRLKRKFEPRPTNQLPPRVGGAHLVSSPAAAESGGRNLM